jgi:hypothetical protein
MKPLTVVIVLLLASLAAAPAVSITLAWNPSATPGVQYRVKWGFASGAVNHTHPVEAAFALTTTIEEPWAPGTTVYFTAYAWNEGGESGPSNEVSYTVPLAPTPTPTPTPVPPPEPPSNLRRVIEAVLNWWRNQWWDPGAI